MKKRITYFDDKNHPFNYPDKNWKNAGMEFHDLEDWCDNLEDGEVLKVRHTSEMSWVEHEKTKTFIDLPFGGN